MGNDNNTRVKILPGCLLLNNEYFDLKSEVQMTVVAAFINRFCQAYANW
jgi:hypothetical protein